MPQGLNRDPALWWLDFEFPTHRGDSPISMVKVQDYWLLTTDHAIFKFSADHDGSPRVVLMQEF